MSIYYETVRDGLVPVEFVRHLGGGRVEVRVLKNTLCYEKDELIETFRFSIVEKGPSGGIYQMVRAASLP